jgi:putative endonuclease
MARIKQHNSGKGSKYTRTRRPVCLVFSEQCEDKSAALKREIAIKKLPRDQKMELIEKYKGIK